MFSEELEKISWDETTERILSKTDADVRRALAKEHCDIDDFMALISPAAEPYLETMARLSRKYTEERFGRTISMFIPLYITNSCTNSCVYCGFHISNPMKRTILTEEEIENEYKAIKKLAPFENLLLVTGENPAKAGVPYIARALDLAKPYFSNLKIEVMPLKTEEYVVNIEKGAGNADQVIANFTNKEDLKVLGEDIRYIKQNELTLQPKGSFFYGSMTFWLFYIIPALAFIIFFIIYRKQAAENANVAKVRTKKANKVATKRMKLAGKLLSENKKDAFYDEVLKALWGYISDKLNIPVSRLS